MDNAYSENRTEQSGGKAYRELLTYSERTHEVCRWVIKIIMILFFALPVILLIMRSMTGSDKVVTLIIWIVMMFVLAAVMIFVGYFDHGLQKLLDSASNEESSELSGLISIKNRPSMETVSRMEDGLGEMLPGLDDEDEDEFDSTLEEIDGLFEELEEDGVIQ